MNNLSKKGINVERWEQKQRQRCNDCLANRSRHYEDYRSSGDIKLVHSSCPYPHTCPHRHSCLYQLTY